MAIASACSARGYGGQVGVVGCLACDLVATEQGTAAEGFSADQQTNLGPKNAGADRIRGGAPLRQRWCGSAGGLAAD